MRPDFQRSRFVSLACIRRALRALVGGMAALCLADPPVSAAQDTTAIAEEIGALDIDELGRVRITSVSRKPEPAALAAAAVTVISREDIRRMGAMTLPDVLRSVPGMTVARVGARDWAVSARGFNHQLANKLLVLVDGRAVYSPIFGGVFWDMLAFPMNEIDRIEVIRGPGASLWGVNAVTGIVNIITRPAAESHGGRLVAGVGTRHRFRGSGRYGVTFGEGVAYRVYARGRDRRGALLEGGAEAGDGSRTGPRRKTTGDSGRPASGWTGRPAATAGRFREISIRAQVATACSCPFLRHRM